MMGKKKSEKPAADRVLSFGMQDIALEYMAKNYAVNVLIMNRLALLFYQLQKGSPLTDEEIVEVKATTGERLGVAEKAAVADLRSNLKGLADSAVVDELLRRQGEDQQPS